MYIIRREGLSTTQIGYLLNRDHATVIHGLKQVNKYPELLREAEVIYREFKARCVQKLSSISGTRSGEFEQVFESLAAYSSGRGTGPG